MTVKIEKRKNELIQRLIRYRRNKISGVRGRVFDEFITQYLIQTPPSELELLSIPEIYNLIREHWQFSSRRNAGTASVRVYAPNKTTHGYNNSNLVIEICNDDMPFLLDSVKAAIDQLSLKIQFVMHPIISVCRNESGKLIEISEMEAGAKTLKRESFIRIEVSGHKKVTEQKIKKQIQITLTDVRTAVIDWQPMRERMRGVIENLGSKPRSSMKADVREVREFLEWINDDNFTFLGFRDLGLVKTGKKLKLNAERNKNLGILKNTAAPAIGLMRKLPEEIHGFITKPSLLLVSKSDTRATIHRAVNMDVIGVKKIDSRGKVKGFWLFVGLFTSTAYNKSPRDIPLLRRRITKILNKAAYARTSHNGKLLTNILETFPRDELFQASDNYLYNTALGILHLQEHERVALFVRADRFQRFFSCLVYVPRERYSTELRYQMEEILTNTLNGTASQFYTQLGDSHLARIHFVISTKKGKTRTFDLAKLEEHLAKVAQSWSDRVSEILIKKYGKNRGTELIERYGAAFGAGYRDRYSLSEVLADITEIERIRLDCHIGLNFYRTEGQNGGGFRFKIYHFGEIIPLSDAIPVFEHLGFKVIDEAGPHKIDINESTQRPLILHDFGLTSIGGTRINLKSVRDNFHETFEGVWNGEIESDGFNALIAYAGLTPREVMVLRAMCKFLLQAQTPFSQTYMEKTLVANNGIARDIVKMFEAIFYPGAKLDRRSQNRIRQRILKSLEEVENADEDRIIRSYLNLLDNMLRTNFYQVSATGTPKPYLSFKLDPRQIDDLPQPRPFREIFVYGPQIEGVHLRFGKVARGGIRWSDRREDFRTEVLGLVKAQQVKNAVIIPVGSKGGFVVKRPPTSGGKQTLLEEGIECYKTFIRGLLDITDNINGPNILPPAKTVRLDDDDPYLVVAADKGTATFSDIANSVSLEYGHWLGDAFASGGSQGYDHKKMAITARGGWESVRRHFREIGVDIQLEDFTAIGVGDMAGDVFGNGMLLSKHTKLQGAFNHMHIFVDPNPDPVESWKERRRLFRKPGSTWADYDPKRLSAGGSVFSRGAKALDISSEIKKCFSINKNSVTPNELIGSLLRANADLLWFGGIGTYVKASSETHLDVGDRTNDGIRVNGADLKCKVIGEGANLGCTQLGRIEYAMKGGRLNTDSIDNSAGVDSSDHEVNIKVLVDGIVAKGQLTDKLRNTLLARMTDEVAELVLAHNYRQTQAISLIQSKGVKSLANHQRLMRFFERNGRLDRMVEYLPDDEMIGDRQLDQQALTRPEISVLLSYAKIWLYDEIMASDMPNDNYLFNDLLAYFPTPLQKKYKKDIGRHRLRREIIATCVTNSLVDRAGDTFVLEFMEKTGLDASVIARAYVITREVFNLRRIWAAIEALDNRVASATQVDMLRSIHNLMEWVVLWFLRNGERSLDLKSNIETYRTGVQELVCSINATLPEHYVTDVELRAKAFRDVGVPKDLALDVVGLVNVYSACDIVRLAARRKTNVNSVARVYFMVGSRFRLGRLRAAANNLDSESHWQKLAVAALIEEIYAHQLALTNHVIDCAGLKTEASKSVELWIDANTALVDPIEQLLSELWASEVNDLSMVTVASRQFRAMIDGCIT